MPRSHPLALVLLIGSTASAPAGCGAAGPCGVTSASRRDPPVEAGEPAWADTGAHAPALALAAPAPVTLAAPEPAPVVVASSPTLTPPGTPRSPLLRCGFFDPMPGGVLAGYSADTGLDIAGSPRAVHAVASGTLDYSEPGHTLWVGPGDTANTVRIELDQPIALGDRRITHVWYAHLSALEVVQREGERPRRHVEGGERIGVSGRANGSPHLHLGLLLDGDTTQRWGTFLGEADVRRVLFCGTRTGSRLAGLAAPSPAR